MTDHGERTGERRFEGDETGTDLGRVLALSDGVFAIALTVLVLEIAVPATTTAATLGRELRDLGPKYFAYVLTFMTIGTLWFIHQLAFRRIIRGRRGLLDPATGPEWIRLGRLRALVGPIVFIVSIPAAAFAPYAAEALWMLTWPLRLLAPRLVGWRSTAEDA